jgi:tRNA1Val (adenine37-N6)-methyltransferase
MADLTCDGFMNGRIVIKQPRRGYRFSIDAVILASSIFPRTGEVVLDMGTGCGIIPIIMVCRNPGINVFGIEVQKQLADLAVLNVATNNLHEQIKIFHADLRIFHPEMIGRPVDWIVCNPPYRRLESGRMNPDAQKALARHEINLDLPQLMGSVCRLLRTGGHFMTIYGAGRTNDLLVTMRSAGVEPKWMRSIHPRPAEPAKLVLVRGAKGANSGMTIAEPLYIQRSNGHYTDELAAMMSS